MPLRSSTGASTGGLSGSALAASVGAPASSCGAPASSAGVSSTPPPACAPGDEGGSAPATRSACAVSRAAFSSSAGPPQADAMSVAVINSATEWRMRVSVRRGTRVDPARCAGLFRGRVHAGDAPCGPSRREHLRTAGHGEVQI